MPPISPIRDRHAQHEASFLRFGESPDAPEVVETFGPLELEYAAIRRGCAVFDMPQRATIRVTGDDRIEYLNRMVTQELMALAPGRSINAFWLNRKGRIDADLRIVHTEKTTWFDLDALSAPRCVETLGAFVFAEDVELADVSTDVHRLVLAGPTAADTMRALGADTIPEVDAIAEVTLTDTQVLVDRHNELGGPTFALHVRTDDVERVYSALMDADEALRVKPAGWHAYNIARIEAGTPLYHLDFGPNSLPAETGVLHDRVNFKKGCYLGQEVVARMDALGHPKQTLVALRLDAKDHPTPEHQPSTGAPVFAGDDEEHATPIGAVTSSTRSPMLGDDIACFAQVKWAHANAGSALRVATGAGFSACTARDALRFWPHAPAATT